MLISQLGEAPLARYTHPSMVFAAVPVGRFDGEVFDK